MARTGPTELTVTFSDDGAGGTRVDLVHGGWPPGESASARRETYDADWTLVLGRLALALPVTA
ncbi:hypothetical protein Wenmar_02562 [Wenxinia marina DSM 24838]|uniref:Uncharacterized protein n=1 Tax=Wenxinia marina DSM 24838 TaxID=1123501 RepID=A0A0D0Q2R2_9RHOB|nr:hypothetical protein Wenmar_02562 [Wenxinia marina DSM 24838]